MEASEIIVGEKVWWGKGEAEATIMNYEKGWVEISAMIDGDVEQRKVRAKELTPLSVVYQAEEDTFEKMIVVPQEESINEVVVAGVDQDPLFSSSEPDSEDKGEDVPTLFDCGCGHAFVPPKGESFTCPECGRWHRVKLHPDLSKYVKGMSATASGRDTVDIDDEVAEMLRGLALDELYIAVCNELHKLDERARFSKAMESALRKSEMTCKDFLTNKYGLLNPGMQRMNLGNLLRGAIKRHETMNLIEEAKNNRKSGEVKNGK